MKPLWPDGFAIRLLCGRPRFNSLLRRKSFDFFPYEIGTFAMPNFIPYSNSPIITLSNDVSFIPVPYLKHGQKS